MKINIEIKTESKDEEKLVKKISKEFDNEYKIKQLLLASDMTIALWDISQMLRSKTKYPPDNMSEQTLDQLNDVEDKFYDILNDNGIDLDDITY